MIGPRSASDASWLARHLTHSGVESRNSQADTAKGVSLFSDILAHAAGQLQQAAEDTRLHGWMAALGFNLFGTQKS